MSSEAPLERPATPDDLAELHRAGLLDVEAFRAAARWTSRPPPPDTWRRILDPLALVLGIALIVAGVLYLVAFNWTELGRFSKVAVGVAPILVVGTILLGIGTDRLPGKVLATAGIPLTLGALLATGLAFPTVGDPTPLLIAWAVLSVAWALSARLGAAWIGVVVATDIAVTTWISASMHYDDALGGGTWDLGLLALLVVHVIAWAGFGGLALARVRWADTWVRHTLLAPAFLILASWPIELIALHSWPEEFSDWVEVPTSALDVVGAVAWVLVGVIVQVGFALKRFAPFPAAAHLLSVLAVVAVGLGRVFVGMLDTDLAFLLTVPLGLVMVLLLALCGGWLVWGWRRQLPAAAETAAPASVDDDDEVDP